MDLSNAWAIAAKDFSIFRKKKYVLYSLVSFPLIISILLPAVIQLLISRKGLPSVGVVILLDAFSFFFIILAVILPVTLASYSIVGEKVEKSLEPLLTTPITDDEFLLGKTLAAFLPALVSAYAGIAIFMVLVDITTRSYLGYLFFPNWNMVIILLLAIPLGCLFSTETNIIISSRINDIRASQQLGALILIPFGAIYVMFEVNFISFNITNLLILCAVVLIADLILFYLTKAIFRREEILTKWK
jgi:ABC-2 type transport system permease protein